MIRRVASCEECGWIADASLVEFGKCPRSCATELRYYPVRSAEVDREALVQLLDDYAVGRHIPEDAAQHRAFIADAILRLLNGGAS